MSFTKASTIRATDSIFNSIWATVKSGKTTYAIGKENVIGHWPLPIYALNYDMRMVELLPFCTEEVRENTFIKDMAPQGPFLTDKAAASMLGEAEDAIREALDGIRSANQGTVVFDTATSHWDLVRKVLMADITKKREAQDKPIYPYDYKEATEYWRSLIFQLRSVPAANILMIHHAQEIYDGGGKPTGFFRPQDSSQQQKLTQVQMMLYKTGKGESTTHNAKIEICGLDTSLEGLELPVAYLDYPNLYRQIFKRESPYVAQPVSP